ncbi:MAG: hemerythrin domain-containing protein, partial [Bacteroidales bacterium]
MEHLLELAEAIVRGENGKPYFERYRKEVARVTPEQVISLIDQLMARGYPVGQLQEGVNKFLNLFHLALKSHPQPSPAQGSFLDWLMRSNREMAARLDAMRPLIKQLNGKGDDVGLSEAEIRTRLLGMLNDLREFDRHYQIKENILFPAIEQHWPDYRCVQLMWAFHDDIRKDIRLAINILENDSPDKPRLNRLFGNIFFNMLAIRFREERILFPVLLKSLPPR